MNKNLISKYNIPAPRYTSYPTVPYWEAERPDDKHWESRLLTAFQENNSTKGIALYLHLPFCESLCTYCGCNTRITKNHQVETPYLQNILKEWKMYLTFFPEKPRLSEMHLGGGTPTFFSPENLRLLLQSILDSVELTPDAEMSFEGHPANTSSEHLKTLASLGFRRVSFGIQDFDPKVQKAIHRFQSVEQVEKVTSLSRKFGYHSVNYDLIYGLPFQTMETMKRTISEVVRLLPDRIAFYSYAHVPWVKPGQRAYDEKDLPMPELKRSLYEYGREQFEMHGYQEIGMDHFALKKDALSLAAQKGKLNRNFMGYTTSEAELLIGLGVSSISDCGTAYIQNEKTLEAWTKRLDSALWPYFKGHLLSGEDLIMRRHIHHLICRYETNWQEPEDQCPALFEAIERLTEMIQDGLVELNAQSLKIKPEGKAFVRNICMCFDARLWRSLPQTQLFSQAV